jgi:hypothetical protein
MCPHTTFPVAKVALDANSLLPLCRFDFGADLSYKAPPCLKYVKAHLRLYEGSIKAHLRLY